jgi:hypothetical protein
MAGLSGPAPPRNDVKAGVSSAAVLVLTTVHHLYGAAIYNTPWRAHIAMPAMSAMLFIIGALYVSHRKAATRLGKVARWLAIGVIALIPVAWIGLFEGGYNHVVKDVLYFSGMPLSLMQRLFPPPLYELPDDVFFELTGVLQFFVALLAIHHTLQFVRSQRKENGG